MPPRRPVPQPGPIYAPIPTRPTEPGRSSSIRRERSMIGHSRPHMRSRERPGPSDLAPSASIRSVRRQRSVTANFRLGLPSMEPSTPPQSENSAVSPLSDHPRRHSSVRSISSPSRVATVQSLSPYEAEFRTRTRRRSSEPNALARARREGIERPPGVADKKKKQGLRCVVM